MFKSSKTVAITETSELYAQVGILNSVDMFKLTDCWGSNIILNKWEIERLYKLVLETEKENKLSCSCESWTKIEGV